jgi:hypothetical protein
MGPDNLGTLKLNWTLFMVNADLKEEIYVVEFRVEKGHLCLNAHVL